MAKAHKGAIPLMRDGKGANKSKTNLYNRANGDVCLLCRFACTVYQAEKKGILCIKVLIPSISMEVPLDI